MPLRLTAFKENYETGVTISVREETLPEDKENEVLQQQREAQKRKNSPRAPLRAISSVFSFLCFVYDKALKHLHPLFHYVVVSVAKHLLLCEITFNG